MGKDSSGASGVMILFYGRLGLDVLRTRGISVHSDHFFFLLCRATQAAWTQLRLGMELSQLISQQENHLLWGQSWLCSFGRISGAAGRRLGMALTDNASIARNLNRPLYLYQTLLGSDQKTSPLSHRFREGFAWVFSIWVAFVFSLVPLDHRRFLSPNLELLFGLAPISRWRSRLGSEVPCDVRPGWSAAVGAK